MTPSPVPTQRQMISAEGRGALGPRGLGPRGLGPRGLGLRGLGLRGLGLRGLGLRDLDRRARQGRVSGELSSPCEHLRGVDHVLGLRVGVAGPV